MVLKGRTSTRRFNENAAELEGETGGSSLAKEALLELSYPKRTGVLASLILLAKGKQLHKKAGSMVWNQGILGSTCSYFHGHPKLMDNYCNQKT